MGIRAGHHRSGTRARRVGPAACALAATLAGCALTPPSGDAVRTGASADAPALRGAPDPVRAAAPAVADLVAALGQLREPRLTTIQVGPNDDPTVDALVGALADAGYGIQRVAADQGANFLDWTFGPAGAEASPTPAAPGVASAPVPGTDARRRARLRVGALSLSRDYLPGGARGALVAASPLEIGGTRTAVALDDAARLPGTPAEHSRVVFAAGAPELGATPIISLVTEDVVRGVAARATRAAARGRPPATRQAINSNRVEVSNLFFGSSAFGALRADMMPVATDTILFGDDSMRLGADGKRQIARFIEDYRAEGDMIGLVGCSNGPTKLAIGNEGLALGRSARVTDELVALGVERSRILDEGCWAGRSATGRFPSRGVVIELLRADP